MKKLDKNQQCIKCLHWRILEAKIKDKYFKNDNEIANDEIDISKLTFVEFYCIKKHIKPKGYKCKDFKNDKNVEIETCD